MEYSKVVLDRLNSLTHEQKTVAVAVAGGGIAVGAALLGYKLITKKSTDKKIRTLDLSGGDLDKSKVKEAFNGLTGSYGKIGDGTGIQQRDKTPQLVDTFYNLVTDIYEWGWGTSFHFSPQLPGKTTGESQAAHEARIPALLGLEPGKKCLDAGCGVGGPMRTIAAASQGKIVGITINSYQVKRAKYHNEKHGLANLCEVVEGNFLELPFEDESFDCAYAIEATCHAPKLDQVYAEIYRVLKPGGRFVSYEWVTTKLFDPNNDKHMRIIDEINYGNGLPEMRTYKAAEEAGMLVGFKLMTSRDLAQYVGNSEKPWWTPLKLNRFVYHGINHFLVTLLTLLGIAPKGMSAVHKWLLDTADTLVESGEEGIFTPMQLLVFEKPHPPPPCPRRNQAEA